MNIHLRATPPATAAPLSLTRVNAANPCCRAPKLAGLIHDRIRDRLHGCCSARPRKAGSTVSSRMGCGHFACLGHLRAGDGRVSAASVLTPLAHDLGITEGAAGQTMTATAIAAAISAPTMAIITKRLDRRIVLCAMMLLQILSNLLAEVAWSLPVFLAARVVLGIALGGFWFRHRWRCGSFQITFCRAPCQSSSPAFRSLSYARLQSAPMSATSGDGERPS